MAGQIADIVICNLASIAVIVLAGTATNGAHYMLTKAMLIAVDGQREEILQSCYARGYNQYKLQLNVTKKEAINQDVHPGAVSCFLNA